MRCRYCGEQIKLIGHDNTEKGVWQGREDVYCYSFKRGYVRHAPPTEEDIIDKVLKKYETLDQRFPLIKTCKVLFSGNSGKAS